MFPAFEIYLICCDDTRLIKIEPHDAIDGPITRVFDRVFARVVGISNDHVSIKIKSLRNAIDDNAIFIERW